MGRLTVWIVVAWITPAAIAGAAGWKGVWGSGSAFGDYLMPFPVAGGMLHVLTLVPVSVLLATRDQWPAWFAGLQRGLLLALSLAGVVLLLDVRDLYLAATTDAVLHGGLPWEENPLGLFLLTDSLLAQLFVGWYGGRFPDGAREWLLSLAVVAAAPALAALAMLNVMNAGPGRDQPFMPGAAGILTPERNETVNVYTRLPVHAPEFRQAAEQYVAQWHPNQSVNSEDVAVRFFTSLEAARTGARTGAAITYCLYEDGAPAQWLPADGDCFSHHENFTERVQRLIEAQDRRLPVDVRVHLARFEACKGATLPTGPQADGYATHQCLRIEERRQEMLKKFGDDPAVAEALRAP